MRLEMRGGDHNPLCFGSFTCKVLENMIKYAHAPPADESIIKNLVRTKLFRRVFALQDMANHINDPAHNPPVIYAENAMSEGKERRDARHLLFTQYKLIAHGHLRESEVSFESRSNQN